MELNMMELGKGELHVAGPERMTAVLDLLAPYVERYQLNVEPDAKSWSVTISRRGKASECANITVPDRYFRAMAERVCTGANIDVVSA